MNDWINDMNYKDAFQEGREAFDAGNDQNPYDEYVFPNEYYGWNAGYDTALDESYENG